MVDSLTDREQCHETQRRCRTARRAGLRAQQEVEIRLRPAEARRDGRRLCLRRGADRPDPDRRRRPHRPRPHRLRGQLLGQPRHPLVRTRAVPARHDDRPDRAGRDHGPRREAAVSLDQAGDRRLPSGGRLRLQHLRPRADRRRHRGGLQGGPGALGRAGGADRLRRLLRHQEPGQPHRRRRDGQVRDRHPRARPGAGRRRRHGSPRARCQPDRRVQHRRRAVARPAAARRTRSARPLHALGRRPLPRSADDAPGQGEHDGLLQGAAQRRAQARGEVRHPLVRGQYLRRGRHVAGTPRLRPAAGRPGPDRAHRGRDRPRGRRGSTRPSSRGARA